jgi:hypothetical protein
MFMRVTRHEVKVIASPGDQHAQAVGDEDRFPRHGKADRKDAARLAADRAADVVEEPADETASWQR